MFNIWPEYDAIDYLRKYQFPFYTQTFGPSDAKVTQNEDSSVTIQLNAIGLDKENIEIEIVNDILHIKSSTAIEENSISNDINYTYALDKSLDYDSIDAKCKNGILTIVIKKQKNTDKTKKIKIQ